MSKQQYDELVEGTYVEPGHDVAPGKAWVADCSGGRGTHQRVINPQSDAERSRKIGRQRRKRLEEIEAKENSK